MCFTTDSYSRIFIVFVTNLFENVLYVCGVMICEHVTDH